MAEKGLTDALEQPASKHKILFSSENTALQQWVGGWRCWPLLNAHRLSSGMIKGIWGWESCNLWRSVMIWLWLLSAAAKGNHLLQHVREIKGAADGFLTEREKRARSSGSVLKM